MTTILNILRIVSLLVWIAVGVVTLLGTWRVFQKTEELLGRVPGQLQQMQGSFSPQMLQELLQKYYQGTPQR